MTEAIEARAFEAVSHHARFADLVALTRGVTLRIARARALSWAPLADLPGQADEGALKEEDAKTDLGNVFTVLEHGPKTADERALVKALWAHVIAESRSLSAEEEDELVSRTLWLAAFTPFDATLLLDRALGDAGDAFWPALGERLRRIDAGETDSAGSAEGLAAAVALRSSSSSAASKEMGRLATRVQDPGIRALLEKPEKADKPRDVTPIDLTGELATPPRHPLVTTLLAVTGLLFISAFVRIGARAAFGYRRPAEVLLTAGSVRVRARTLILGRPVRERDIVLARAGLARAIREVRYPRAAFYAGLLCLALGSLLGVHTFVDGVRSASPSLLFYGLLVIAIGIGLDFLLAMLDRGRPGTCGVVFVTRDGSATAVRGVDATLAERALRQLAEAA